MKNALTALTLASLVSFSALAADTYTVDTEGAHASVNFKVEHLGYSFIQGRFNTFEGEFVYDPANIENSSVSVVVDTTSLDSNHAERDKHLRSGDFINADKFGIATFTSTEIQDEGEGEFAIIGDLTLHGVTKPITIEAELIGAGQDPWGGYRAGFEGETRIELADFGIPVVGASSYVELELHVEGIKQ
uniref:YceI family protein n=1 Tax=Thaumasiovibrio occultus TaxID=1891184 RepID=UPI000B35B39A|nr:YceI family protein [Thaumasiovibrio occultus]